MAPPMHWVSFSPGYPLRAGVAEVGVTVDPAALDSFAFDNETPRHPVYIAPFRLASRPVTCAEYLAFLDEDGYSRPELWLSEGWDAMRAGGWQAPLYWQHDPNTRSGWSVFTLTVSAPWTSFPKLPSAISVSSKLTPSPAGPAIACPPSSSGSSSPRSSP